VNALGQFDYSLIPLAGALPSNHSREMLSGTANQETAQTISRMQDMVTLGKREFSVRKLLQQFVFDCTPKDYYCYARKAHEFCRDQIRYVFDPSGVELIENPARTLESRVADCDSIVILMAALCEQMGFPCRFVTIKADKGRPNDFSHVFLEVKIPNQGWVGSDPTQPTREFGWEPGAEFPRKTWPASKDGVESHDTDEMAGMSGMSCSGCMGYMGEAVPGVQETPGVIVEKPWQFRQEPVLVVAHPEQLELDPLQGKTVPYTAGTSHDFMYATQAENMFEHEPVAFLPQVTVQSAPAMSGFGAMSNVPSWVYVLGAAAVIFWLMKRKS
jgi:Transglutaminase-like superfamily